MDRIFLFDFEKAVFLRFGIFECKFLPFPTKKFLKNLIKMRSISGIFKPCACGANFRKIFINLQSGVRFCFANWGQPKSRFVDCCQRLLATTPFITCALTPVRPKESVKRSKKEALEARLATTQKLENQAALKQTQWVVQPTFYHA